MRVAATATSPDLAAADHRLRQWQQVITGTLSGSLHIGSRTPVGRATAWVTLEVAHGGFATGNLAASGPIQPHELTMLSQLDRPADGTARALLNLHFLSDVGRHQLQTLLTDGTFRVRVPEEGALLVAVWLLGQGQTERAAGLIETITPLFDRLRFYPLPERRPLRADTGVCIQTVGEIVRSLQATRPRQHIERSNEAAQVWAPLSDRAVALFAETVDGDLPSLQRAADATLVRAANSQPIVIGGWPCRHFAADWSARAQVLLDEYASQRPNHPHCAKPDRPKENFARLRGYLQACITDPRTLSGKDVGMIRKIVASVDARRGVVGSERHKHLRSAQLQLAQRPTHAALARLLSQRLEPLPLQEGLTDPQALLEPLTAAEQTTIGATLAAVIPISLKNKVMCGWQAPLDVLVHHQLVPSSEAMARVLPALKARVRAAAIADPNLRRVYEEVYVAFRRRRSLLLLDLSSQVKLGELPWFAAVQPWLGSTTASRDAARATLAQVVALTLTAFPHTLLPNKLVRECRALAATAELTLPLVEELASDIFMGSFSGQFLQAGHEAARLLTGTLYERYYGLAFAQLAAINDLQSDDKRCLCASQ
ncbi:MAG: hypothetical protein EXR77_18350 [Myxococcales bacterium]|nr:hypothetical protein [Myxococcales bacterium]